MKISRRPLEPGVPSVAMADIAFNLVLFFIIMARAQDDSHLQWEPAKASPVKRFTDPAVSITVTRKEPDKNKDHMIYLNGKQVSITGLSTAIGELLGNAPAGKRSVLLKISEETPAVLFEPIIEAVSQAGGDVVHVLNDEQINK
jgi:biopolymer transport protein ExbD